MAIEWVTIVPTLSVDDPKILTGDQVVMFHRNNIELAKLEALRASEDANTRRLRRDRWQVLPVQTEQGERFQWWLQVYQALERMPLREVY